MAATLQYVHIVYINLSVHNRQVLRLMYRIHYIVFQESYSHIALSSYLHYLHYQEYPYFCIVASCTAVYIPLIPWFADLCHALTVASCFNMSYIALSFRHCKHTAFLIMLYILLTFIIN